MKITDKGMQAKPTEATQWLSESLGHGFGSMVGRISATGERHLYFRYSGTKRRETLPIGPFDPRGDGVRTFSVAQARAKAQGLSAIYRQHSDLREHLEAKAAEEATAQKAVAEQHRLADIARQQRLTVRQLFDRWRETDLRLVVQKNGDRQGRKDGGALVLAQFSKHVFPLIGERFAAEIQRSDVMKVLDAIKATGKNRTTNAVLSALRQMFTFGEVRELVPIDPTHGINKRRDAGGKDAERDRCLSDAEVKALHALIPTAKLHERTKAAIWLVLATGCRIGELVGATLHDPDHPKDGLKALADDVGAKHGIVDLKAKQWLIFDTKNQDDHLIHLSPFAIKWFETLAGMRMAGEDDKPTPWLFPNRENSGPVCPKTINKQIQDRQRKSEERMSRRAKATNTLLLEGGQWRPHDLRRTAATMMSRLGVATAVINLCLNHKLLDKLDRIYIRDDRMADRMAALALIGSHLERLTTPAA